MSLGPVDASSVGVGLGQTGFNRLLSMTSRATPWTPDFSGVTEKMGCEDDGRGSLTPLGSRVKRYDDVEEAD